MADRVYPSAKPLQNNGLDATGAAAPTKSQLYGATRSAYRPTAQRKRNRRGLCLSCCCWTTLILFILLLLAAAAAAAIYFIYRPQPPTFAVTGLKISSLNLTSNSHVITNININVTARNPNKRLVYIYNPTAITVTTQKDNILIGNGSVPGFVHRTKNTTLLKAAIDRSGIQQQQLDDVSASQLKSELKNKNGLYLKVELETKVKLKMDGLRTPKVGIRVRCEGIKGNYAPAGKTATSATLSKAKCKVDLRIRIWKWTF